MGTKTNREARTPPRPQTEWGSGVADGLVTTVRRDGDRATVVDVGDGVVRVRMLRLVRGVASTRPGGRSSGRSSGTRDRWAALSDTTLETACELTPIDDDPSDPDGADAAAMPMPLRLLRAA